MAGAILTTQPRAAIKTPARVGFGFSLGEVTGEKTTGRDNRLLLEGRSGIADRQALQKVLPKEGPNSAEPLILRRVSEFVCDQRALAPAVAPHKDAVTQSEAAGGRREELNRGRRGLQSEIAGHGDARKREQAHPLRRAHADRPRVRHFLLRERNALAQDAFLDRSLPLHGEGQERLEMRDQCLSIHEFQALYLMKRNPRGRRAGRTFPLVCEWRFDD